MGWRVCVVWFCASRFEIICCGRLVLRSSIKDRIIREDLKARRLAYMSQRRAHRRQVRVFHRRTVLGMLLLLGSPLGVCTAPVTSRVCSGRVPAQLAAWEAETKPLIEEARIAAKVVHSVRSWVHVNMGKDIGVRQHFTTDSRRGCRHMHGHYSLLFRSATIRYCFVRRSH